MKNYDLHAFRKPKIAPKKHKNRRFKHDIGNHDAAVELGEEARQIYEEVTLASHVRRAVALRD